jgi:hypothetical protein
VLKPVQTRSCQWKTKIFMITILICWVHWKENKNYSTYIYVFAARGLLSALLFSREGFCPPCHFYGRAFVRPDIFTGGLLSALSFSREGFCPPCHFLMGGLLSGRAFVLHSLFFYITFLVLKVSTSNFKYLFLIIYYILCDKVYNSWSNIYRFNCLWT